MTVTRREALRTIALGTLTAPAVLRRRYQLLAQSNAQYSERAVRLVESQIAQVLGGNAIRVLGTIWPA